MKTFGTHLFNQLRWQQDRLWKVKTFSVYFLTFSVIYYWAWAKSLSQTLRCPITNDKHKSCKNRPLLANKTLAVYLSDKVPFSLFSSASLLTTRLVFKSTSASEDFPIGDLVQSLNDCLSQGFQNTKILSLNRTIIITFYRLCWKVHQSRASDHLCQRLLMWL